MTMDAADWFTLKRSGEMTPEQLIDFQAWLEADPANRVAFEEAEDSWALAGLLREDPEMLLLRAQARRAYPAIPRRVAVAAVVAAIGVIATGWYGFKGVTLRPPGVQEQAFKTGVGQRTTLTLGDGSVITLDADSVLRTRESGRERRMYLDRGRALFHVAKDPTRPFVVEAAGRRITALGTVFDVDVAAREFEVTLVEGAVRVEQPRLLLRPTQTAELKAGYRIEAKSASTWTVEPADVAKETGWTEGRLTFVDDPLAEVAAEMNRYSDRKIILKDPEVGREPVVAVLKPGDLDSFVKMVRTYQLAEVIERDDAIELRAIAPSSWK